MTIRTDDKKGWVGSVVLHLGIGLIFFLWNIDFSITEPEFIEVSWGTIADVSSAPLARPSLPGTEGSTSTSALVPKTGAMDLPERKFDVLDEVLKIPLSRKMDVDEQPGNVRTRVAEHAKGEKGRSAGIGLGQKENFSTSGVGEYAGEVAGPKVPGMVGRDVGKSVSLSMQWSGGGTRNKISGNLPTYPPGVNVEAQIKIEAVVLPDGNIKSLKPAQKANTMLEEAAMSEIRLWKFEPLRKSLPQREQTCLITFNFTLQ
ncbi:MAG: energy transducer TonB [Ignavibacteria bacterium]|nr:energy transducer TonB [Ignavibacteria bacterium]